MSEKIQQKWETASTKVLETPKFLKQGTKVIVNATVMPRKTEVEGRYGKREVYIIDTSDYGLVYVNGLQLVHIVEVLQTAKFENVTVEL